MKRKLHSLPIRFTKVAAKGLVDFANTRTEGFERFEWKWGERTGGNAWRGGIENFKAAQKVVRDVWEGKTGGPQAVSWGLGLRQDHPEYQGSSMHLLSVNWEDSSLWLLPRDLNEYMWLSLLQYSQRLGICANKENECPTPYFVKNKPNQRFCSEACALPTQREFKRQWFREHGEEWRRKWLKKRGKVETVKRGRQ